MAAYEDSKTILSGATYTFTGGGMAAGDFKKLGCHSISISGSGSATVTFGFPTGAKSGGAIGVAGSDVFYYPGVTNIIVTAVAANIVVDFYSFEGNL